MLSKNNLKTKNIGWYLTVAVILFAILRFYPTFGAGVEGVISVPLNLLKEEGFGPALALVIIVVACGVGVYIFRTYKEFNKILKRAKENLGDSDDRIGFYEDFENIKQEFDKFKNKNNDYEYKIYRCWREFCETIIHPNRDNTQDNNIIKNTIRPHEYFNAESAGFTTPVLNIIPNALIGVGLVLTFAGLIAALAAAVQGIGGNTEQAQASLIDLLSTTSAKFYTSLAALLSSIILTIFLKILSKNA